jgi:hypothetical protein
MITTMAKPPGKSIITAVVREKGLTPEQIDRRLSVHALLMAAKLHCESGGNAESFIHMARRSLALARTGAVEQ